MTYIFDMLVHFDPAQVKFDQRSRSQEENAAQVVGATSSEGFLVFADTTAFYRSSQDGASCSTWQYRIATYHNFTRV